MHYMMKLYRRNIKLLLVGRQATVEGGQLEANKTEVVSRTDYPCDVILICSLSNADRDSRFVLIVSDELSSGKTTA